MLKRAFRRINIIRDLQKKRQKTKDFFFSSSCLRGDKESIRVGYEWREGLLDSTDTRDHSKGEPDDGSWLAGRSSPPWLSADRAAAQPSDLVLYAQLLDSTIPLCVLTMKTDTHTQRDTSFRYIYIQVFRLFSFFHFFFLASSHWAVNTRLGGPRANLVPLTRSLKSQQRN